MGCYLLNNKTSTVLFGLNLILNIAKNVSIIEIPNYHRQCSIG